MFLWVGDTLGSEARIDRFLANMATTPLWIVIRDRCRVPERVKNGKENKVDKHQDDLNSSTGPGSVQKRACERGRRGRESLYLNSREHADDTRFSVVSPRAGVRLTCLDYFSQS